MILAFNAFDWNLIAKPEPYDQFFGRKFQPVISQSILDMVDAWISVDYNEENMIKPLVPNWNHSSRTRYWENIYHYLDSNLNTAPDAKIDLASTLIRLSIDTVLHSLSKSYKSHTLQEITSYHKNDSLEGILINFSVEEKGCESENEFEILIKHKRDIQANQQSLRRGKFEVGSNIDYRENVFKNWMNVVNEDSDVPILMYSFEEDTNEEKKDFLIRASWFDPTGNLKFFADKNVTSYNVTTFEPDITSPMLSGIWTVIVIMVDSNKLLARIPFLVFPSKNVSSTINLSANYNIPENGKALLNIFHESKSELDIEFEKINKGHLKAHNDDLEYWRKLLVNQFYIIDDVCIIDQDQDHISNENYKRLYKHFTSCKDTVWSSMSPDPKSSIFQFNEAMKILI